MKEKADKASITIKSLETFNEELKVKVRQLEFSTNDLTMKLEDAEEAIILLRENAEAGKSSRRQYKNIPGKLRTYTSPLTLVANRGKRWCR